MKISRQGELGETTMSGRHAGAGTGAVWGAVCNCMALFELLVVALGFWPDFHLVKNIFVSPVGLKGNLSLLEILFCCPGDLSKWREIDGKGVYKSSSRPKGLAGFFHVRGPK